MNMKRGIGIAFIVLGIVWAAFNSYFCNRICSGMCNYNQISPCYFLFVFVGIIFIVSGFSLASLSQDENPKKIRRS